MNEDVDGMNNDLINKFPGEAVVYKSSYMILDEACILFHVLMMPNTEVII